MGSVRKLQKAKEVKATAVRIKRYVFSSGVNMGMKLAPYIPWRSPMKFYYAKMRRRVNVKRIVEGVRTFFSYNWRRILLSPGHQPLKFFSASVSAVRENAKRIFRKWKTDSPMLIERQMKSEGIKREKGAAVPPAAILRETGKPEKQVRERAFEVRVEPPVAVPPRVTEPIKIREAKSGKFKVMLWPSRKYHLKAVHAKMETSREAECREPGYKRTAVRAQAHQAPTLKQRRTDNVPKDVKREEKMGKFYKPEAINATPQTSTRYAEGDWVGKGERTLSFDASNTRKTDIALAVRPYSFFESSFKTARVKTDKTAKPSDVQTQKTKVALQEKDEDYYHVLNKMKKDMVLPKIASGAADSIT